MDSYHLLPKPRYSPTMTLIRQNNVTSRDPEMPHPLRIYFLNAEVTSWLISEREALLALVKTSKKERFVFTFYLPHWVICRLSLYLMATTYYINSKIIFFQNLTPLKVGWIVWSMVSYGIDVAWMNFLCKNLFLTVIWGHYWPKTTLN